MMRYIHVETPGGPEAMKVAMGPIPSPQAGEVLIKVHASGVNRPDILQRMGKYPPPKDASAILGLEVSGTIVACHESVKGCKVGEKICALVPGGGYAEYVIAPFAQCLPLPQNLTEIEAACIPETFFTVWFNLFMRGKLTSGERVLIHGGSSGIGTTAIQLANAFGAQVIITAGSEEKCKSCLNLGATFAINYHTTDFYTAIVELTQMQGIDVILDMVGGSYFDKNVKLLAVDGRLIQIAVMGGYEVKADLRQFLSKRLTLCGSTLRPLPIVRKAEIAKELQQQVWPLLEKGTVKPVIEAVFKLEDVAKAHELMEKGTHIGKIALTF